MKRAERQNSLCQSCANKKSMNRSESRIRMRNWMKKNCPTKRPDVLAKISGKNGSNWRPRGNEYTRWREYELDVDRITKHQLKENPPFLNFDKRGRCGIVGAYQVDHIISKDAGFKQGISAEVIGAHSNLRMISWEDNRKKGK